VSETASPDTGVFQFLKRVRENPITLYTPDTLARPFSRRRVLFQNFALVNEPEWIRHVLVTHHENYGKGRLNRQILRPALGDGLLTSEGAFWRRQRRIAAPAFQQQRLALLADGMVAVTLAVATRWQAAANDGAVLDVSAEMMSLTMEIVVRALFSADVAGEVEPLGNAVGTLIAGFGRPSLLDLLGLPEWLPRRRDPRALAARQTVDRFIYRILGERRRAPPAEARDDLLGLLLAARDEETGEGMTDRQLRDETITLFAAGHETTAVALGWTWYLLSQNPAAEARLHAEVDALPRDRPLGFADLDRLVWTRMAFEEAMRLYPPAFSLNRVARADDEIAGHRIAAGTLVTASPWVTHHNPRLWPEPDRFDPERFLPERSRERPRYAYFPFGGGPRVCIGSGFALLEACLILATLAQRFRLRLVAGQTIEPLGRVTLRPRHGIRMTLERR